MRVIRIGSALLGYGVWWLLVHWRWLRPRETPGERLCQTLETLGTTFIKLGQGLGLRRDLLPEEYVAPLQALQERVPPFPGELAQAEIERALKRPIEQLFANFDPVPLAAASIAQVHAVRLPDGREAVVKVRRPGIKEQVHQDLRILRQVMRALQRLVPPLERLQPLAVIREIEINLYRELDLRQEAHSIGRFVAAFDGWDTIYVPAVIDDLYAETVVVQERSYGVRVDDPAVQFRRPELARALVDAYLHQFLVLGMFHGDPHPGNVYVMVDGRLCLHDFGLVGSLDFATRRNLAAYFQALMAKDAEWLLDVYLELGIVSEEIDRRALCRALEELLRHYASLPLKYWSLGEIFARTARAAGAHNVHLPHDLLVLMRTAVLLETTTRLLDEAFNPFEYLVERADRLARGELGKQKMAQSTARLKYEAGFFAQDLPGEFGLWLRKMRREGPELRVHHRGLEQFERHVDRASNRVALALVILGLYIAASLLMQASAGPRLAGVPLTALVGYGLALLFTLRLVRGITRSGRL